MIKRSKTDCKTNFDNYLEDYITDEYFNTTEIENGNNQIIKCQIFNNLNHNRKSKRYEK